MGNLREVFTTHLVAEALRARGHDVVHLHSWDDYDRLRKVPAGVDRVLRASTSAGRSRRSPTRGIPPRAPTPSTGCASSPPRCASSASSCTRCASPSATRPAPTTPRSAARWTRASAIFDTLAAQQTSGRHDKPLEERRARVLPLQAVLRDVRARRHAGHRLRGRRRDLPLPPRARGHDVARRRRADQRQARLEGRLADALGATRASRSSPPARTTTRRRAASPSAARSCARSSAAQPPHSAVYSFVSLAGMGGKMSGSAGGAADPRDGAARARAGDRALAVHPPAAVAVLCDRPHRRRACRSSTTSGIASSPPRSPPTRAPPTRRCTRSPCGRRRATSRPRSGASPSGCSPRRPTSRRATASRSGGSSPSTSTSRSPRSTSCSPSSSRGCPARSRTSSCWTPSSARPCAPASTSRRGPGSTRPRARACGRSPRELGDAWTLDGLTALVYAIPKVMLGLPRDAAAEP